MRLFLALMLLFLFTACALGTFMFTLSDPAIDFGNVSIGNSQYGVPAGNLKITCKSDQGNPWSLTMRGAGDLDSGAYRIPLANLKWFGTYTNRASVTASDFITTATSLEVIDRMVYRSDPTGDSGLSSGTAVYVQFGITVPDTQPQGTYSTQAMITMTE